MGQQRLFTPRRFQTLRNMPADLSSSSPKTICTFPLRRRRDGFTSKGRRRRRKTRPAGNPCSSYRKTPSRGREDSHSKSIRRRTRPCGLKFIPRANCPREYIRVACASKLMASGARFLSSWNCLTSLSRTRTACLRWSITKVFRPTYIKGAISTQSIIASRIVRESNW